MTSLSGNIIDIPASVSEPGATTRTITLVSNQHEIICSDPRYHARVDAGARVKFGTSFIAAQPQSDFGFPEICYIELAIGRQPVVVGAGKDGSIRIGGAYVDSIVRELNVPSVCESGET